MREVHFDVTHLASRFWTETPAGIDRVDLAFARSLLGEAAALASGVHQGPIGASRVGRPRVAKLVASLERRWLENLPAADLDPLWAQVTAWLAGKTAAPRIGVTRLAHDRAPLMKRLRAHTLYRHSFTGLSPALARAARGSLYLNTSQAGLTAPGGLAWLTRRPDVTTAFFIHDLLPVQHPDLFPDALAAGFAHLVPNLARHAAGLIFASAAVRDDVLAALAAHGRGNVPSIVTAIPPTPPRACNAFDAALAASPYFVVLGTIEPRKNHALLLDVWDAMLAEPKPARPVPKLLIVGARGWKNEAVLDRLRQSRGLGDHVLETSGLSTPAVSRLLAHSAGLLFPTLAEGFGLPLSEAQMVGAPALVSDIAVFRERQTGGMRLLPLTNVSAWIDGVRHLCDVHGDGAGVGVRMTEAAARHSAAKGLPPALVAFLNDL